MTAALPEPINAPLTRTLSTVKKPSPGAMNTHNTEPTHSASGHGKAQLYYGLHIKWPLSSSAGSCILVDQMCDELFQGILQTHPKLRTLDLVGGVCPAIPPVCMELGVHHKDTMQASSFRHSRKKHTGSRHSPGTCTPSQPYSGPLSTSILHKPAQGSWDSAIQFANYRSRTLNTYDLLK